MSGHTFNNGDLVRFKANGREFILEDINPNPNYIADDETWADGYNGNGSVEVDSPADIELVMTAAGAAARKVPSAAEIANQISSDIHSGFGGVVDIDESEPDGPGMILAYGRASNGLRVAFKITISEVEETTF